MYHSLTRELLDLTAAGRGKSAATFAFFLDCCSCSCCGCVAFCS